MISYKFHTVDENNQRKAEQEKAFWYYVGDRYQINKYLESALNITFNSDDIEEFQKHYINITKKIIKQLSAIYREPASRKIIDKDGKEKEDLTIYYNNVIPFDINSVDKTVSRYTKLFNTTLTQVKFDGRKIAYDVLPSDIYDVKVDYNDPYKLTEVSYCKYFLNNGREELYKVVWTDTEHYRTKKWDYKGLVLDGDKEPIGTNTKMINPYGRIPFAVYRFEKEGDFWGTVMSDVINFNEQINIMLVELINEHIIMGGAGTLVATNLGLMKQQTRSEERR